MYIAKNLNNERYCKYFNKLKNNTIKKIKQMRLLKSHPILRLVNSYVVDAPQPLNLSYM
jgi:ubiquinol-cytochrome c reductase cytochrome b subunit